MAHDFPHRSGGLADRKGNAGYRYRSPVKVLYARNTVQLITFQWKFPKRKAISAEQRGMRTAPDTWAQTLHTPGFFRSHQSFHVTECRECMDTETLFLSYFL